MEYKYADIDDSKVLIEIYNSAFYDDYLRYGWCPAYGRTKESMEKSLMEYHKIIAYDQSKAVGVISYRIAEPGEYYIGCLGVIKEEQGRGIGTSLMKYFMDEHPDWDEITLVTPKDKESNIKFYTRRFDFEIIGEKKEGNTAFLLFSLKR